MKINGEIENVRDYPSPNPKVRLTEITYWSEGLRVKGLLATPITEAKYDGILYLRGGMQGVGMVRPARITQLASHGFIVFAPYYRGTRGGEGRDEFGGQDRFDAVNAVDVLKHFCNLERIHIFAFSRGGMMALWTGILRDDITSIVTWGGVSNTKFTYEERVDMRRMMKRVLGGSPQTNPFAYEERTPISRISEIDTPVLIIHGMLDKNVGFKHAQLLENGLKSLNKHVETWYYPEYTHFFPSEVNRKVVDGACQWMKLQQS
ncbi:alpha/beta hydrolase family protein [Rummeliibacillus pycnus]|uniref:alpha/beta hydrolase family protein n=1 Tax=Rummeliibacillus pycnus TaxID=101070 RepID=UPI003D29E7F2